MAESKDVIEDRLLAVQQQLSSQQSSSVSSDPPKPLILSSQSNSSSSSGTVAVSTGDNDIRAAARLQVLTKEGGTDNSKDNSKTGGVSSTKGSQNKKVNTGTKIICRVM